MTESTTLRTLADVITKIEQDAELSDTRRRDMLSALRTACRAFSKDPAEVPADPRLLRAYFDGMSPVQAGFSQGRWTNIRSLTLTAMQQAGVKAMPGRFQVSLLPRYADLRRLLPTIRARHALSRFFGDCSSLEIQPQELSIEVFAAFGRRLESESLVRRPYQVYRDTCLQWNWALDNVPGWPDLRVPVPSRSRRLALEWSDFPASFREDVEAYLAHLGGGNAFG